MPVLWKGTRIQYSGRLLRRHPAKKEVQIFDSVNRDVPVLVRMLEKRLPTCRAIGYARGEAPLGFAARPDETTSEYDEEALRYFEEDDGWLPLRRVRIAAVAVFVADLAVAAVNDEIGPFALRDPAPALHREQA